MQTRNIYIGVYDSIHYIYFHSIIRPLWQAECNFCFLTDASVESDIRFLPFARCEFTLEAVDARHQRFLLSPADCDCYTFHITFIFE